MSTDAISRARERFQREAERVRRQVHEAGSETERIRDEARTETADSPNHAADQIAEIRARLDRDLTTLEARLPPRDVLTTRARTVGGAAVGGVGGLTALGLVLKRRGKRRSHERDLRVQAAEIARFLPGAADPDVSDDGGSKRAGGWRRLLRLGGLIAAGAVAGVAAYRRSSGDTGEGSPD